MIKLVVFDWNGVLIADAAATVAVDKELFEEFGHKPLDMKTYREIFTMPVKDFFIAAGFSKEEMNKNAVRIQERFHALYEPRIAKIRTRTGARTLLDFLAGDGIEAIILSNHTIEGITNQLKRLDIETYFSRVIANDMHATMETKNKAGKLLDLLKELPYTKEEVLIIGDSPEETDAGKLAGIKTVAISGGYYSLRRLKEAQPDHLIHNLTELINIIKKV